jgi:hypothetical protein
MKVRIGRPPNHPDEYMIAVAEAVASGLSYREASKRYRVSHGSIAHWLSKLEKSPRKKVQSRPPAKVRETMQKGLPGKGKAALELEIQLLKQELGELYMQVRMLKKAQAFAERMKREDSLIVTSENFEQFRGGAK